MACQFGRKCCSLGGGLPALQHSCPELSPDLGAESEVGSEILLVLFLLGFLD